MSHRSHMDDEEYMRKLIEAVDPETIMNPEFEEDECYSCNDNDVGEEVSEKIELAL